MATHFSLFLIVAGAIVMGLAICETQKILKLVKGMRYVTAWQVLLSLMFFFLLGYAIVGGLIYWGFEQFLLVLVGCIFFFGAVFVFLVVRTSLLTFHDLNRLNKERYELERSQAIANAIAQIRTDFLKIFSHEMRTPLNAILGFAEILKTSGINANQKDLVEEVQDSGHQLLGIINDLIELVKLENQSITLEPTPCNLESLIEDVFQTISHRRPCTIDLLYQVDPKLPEIIAVDSPRLTQMLINLVDNAVKFTPFGEVMITMKALSRDRLVVTVQDTGEGIPAEKLSQIMQPFTQADSSITRPYGGMGLGLAITRKLVELMGGELQLTSQTGIGTTCTFSIDFAVLPPKLMTEFTTIELDEHCPQTVLAGRSILIVSRSRPMQHFLQEQLTRAQARINVAKTLEPWLSSTAQTAIEFIVYDVPGADELALKPLEQLQNVPRLLLLNPIQQDVLPAHPYPVVYKPIRRHALLSAIAQGLTPESTTQPD